MALVDERTQHKIAGAAHKAAHTPAEVETSQKNYEVTEEQAKRMLRRYVVMPGRFMIVREVHARVLSRLRNEAGAIAELPGTEERKGIQALFGGWGTVLMVGKRYLLDSGKYLRPHPLLVPGARVLVGRTPPEELDLAVMGGQVTVGLSNFREVTLIDRGAGAEEDDSLDVQTNDEEE